MTVPAVVALPAALMAIDIEVKPDTPDEFMFDGWRVKWSGWRLVENMDVKVGFWVGYGAPTDQWHLCSAWPGMCRPYVRGAMFDIALRPNQTMPTYDATEKDMDVFRGLCLERLKRLIVEVGPPPLVHGGDAHLRACQFEKQFEAEWLSRK